MRRRMEAVRKGYRLAVESGLYQEAKLLRMMILNGRLLLGLDDVSQNVAMFLEDAGCYLQRNNNGTMVARI